MTNLDKNVIKDFGQEWKAYNQKNLDPNKLLDLFDNYFHIFSLNKINKKLIGFDMGCGSGR